MERLMVDDALRRSSKTFCRRVVRLVEDGAGLCGFEASWCSSALVRDDYGAAQPCHNKSDRSGRLQTEFGSENGGQQINDGLTIEIIYKGPVRIRSRMAVSKKCSRPVLRYGDELSREMWWWLRRRSRGRQVGWRLRGGVGGCGNNNMDRRMDGGSDSMYSSANRQRRMARV